MRNAVTRIAASVLIVTLLLTPLAAGAVTVTLRADATVADDQIWLDDIATVSDSLPERIALGRAPLAGAARQLTAAQVAGAVRRACGRDADITVCGEAVTVRRATTILTGAQIVAAATAAAREQFAHYARVEVELAGAPPADLTVYTSGMTVSAQLQGSAIGGRMTARVVVLHNDRPLKVLSVPLQVTPYAVVAVAAGELVRGTELTAAQVTLAEQPLTGLHGAPVTELSQLAGRRVKRLLAAGAVITRDALEEMPLIANGEEVSVTVLRGGVTLTTRARAREDGCRGESIRLSNLDSGKLLTAEVVAPGTVIIR